MNRIERLQAIITHLQSKRVVKAEELAHRFDVSLRTIYRDLRSLEESGIPLGAEAGVGYFLLDNYHLPPVMFTHEEASAILLAEKLTKGMSDSITCGNFSSAVYKIKALLHTEEKDYLEKIDTSITVLSNSSQRPNALYILDIQQALAKKSVIEIEYTAKSSSSTSLRRIEPIGLCSYFSNWHLFAWCNLRNEYRDFRLDRIVSLKTTSDSFKHKSHPSLEEYLKLTNSSESPNISIIVSNSYLNRLQNSKYYYGFRWEEHQDKNRTRLFFVNKELKGFASWLLNKGCMAEIEYPIELKNTIKDYILSTCHGYSCLFQEPPL